MKVEEFKIPPKSVRPMVRWWWPGIDVTRDELIREVDDLDRAGFGGAELQPFAIGLSPTMVKSDPERAERVHRFMQPYHYEMMQCVMEEAAKRNMFIDITQNSSWPTGGTHVSIPDSHKTLLFSQKVVTGKGTTIQTIEIPPLKKPSMYAFMERIVPKVVDGAIVMHYIAEDKKLCKIIAGKLKNPRIHVGKFSSWKVKRSVLLELIVLLIFRIKSFHLVIFNGKFLQESGRFLHFMKDQQVPMHFSMPEVRQTRRVW